MARPEHLELLHQGAEATWAWRGGRLDLRDAELSGLKLRGARLDQADLSGARLVGADLSGSRLQEANLAGAHLIRATLDDVRLGGARLAGALLCSASLRRSILVRADLTRANLSGADLENAILSHAQLAGTLLHRTKLADAELDHIQGLDQVVHEGPSELGTHALLRFGHQMPANFLRGVGLPDSFIRYLPSIIASARPVDFYSTFICAAPADTELARRLHNDLQSAGIRCWFRPGHAEAPELDEAVRLHERSIILCSRHAQRDPTVIAELIAAGRPGRQRTICITLDDTFVTLVPDTTRDKLMAIDFARWGDFRSYARAFDELVQALMQTP